MREYKVVEVKVRSMFSGAFDGFAFEKLLNKHAVEGWIFDKIVDNESAILKKDTFMIVFYKEK